MVNVLLYRKFSLFPFDMICDKVINIVFCVGNSCENFRKKLVSAAVFRAEAHDSVSGPDCFTFLFVLTCENSTFSSLILNWFTLLKFKPESPLQVLLKYGSPAQS